MPVESNTSPILNLAIIDRLDLLRQQFGQIQIPPAVLEELKIDEERPSSQPIKIVGLCCAVKGRQSKIIRRLRHNFIRTQQPPFPFFLNWLKLS